MSEVSDLAAELASAKQMHRQQLEAMTLQLDALHAKRNALAREVGELQKKCKAELENRQRKQEAAGGKSVDPNTTVTDEQIADALANLLEFSSSKSRVAHSSK